MKSRNDKNPLRKKGDSGRKPEAEPGGGRGQTGGEKRPAPFEISLPIVLLVGLLLSAVSFFYVLYGGPNMPYQDDHRWVAYFSGLESPPLAWFWEAHAGHRIPVVRALTMLIAGPTNFDSRYLFLFTTGILSAACLLMILGVRRARGHSALLDVIFPLYGVSLLHYWNLIQGMQMFLGLYLLLVSILVVGILNRFWHSAAGVLVVGLAVSLLAVNGGGSLAASLLLLPYLLLVAALEFRQRETGGRRRALLLLGIVLPGIVAAGFYAGPILARKFAGGGGGGFDLAALHYSMQEALSRAWAHGSDPLEPDSPAPGSLLIPLLIVFGLICGVWNAKNRKRERPVVLGLSVVLFAVLGVAGAIALGRGPERWEGASVWYSTLMTPLPYVIYLLADGAGRWPRRIAGLLLLFMGISALATTWPRAWDRGAFRRWAWNAMVDDLRRGVPLDEIHDRHHRAFLPSDQNGKFRMDRSLAILKERRQGPFDEARGLWLTGLEWRMHEGRNLLTHPLVSHGVLSEGAGEVHPVGERAVLKVVNEDDAFALPSFLKPGPVPWRLELEFLSPHATEAWLREPSGRPRTAAVRPGFNRVQFDIAPGVLIRELKFAPGREPGNYRLEAIRLYALPES